MAGGTAADARAAEAAVRTATEEGTAAKAWNLMTAQDKTTALANLKTDLAGVFEAVNMPEHMKPVVIEWADRFDCREIKPSMREAIEEIQDATQ